MDKNVDKPRLARCVNDAEKRWNKLRFVESPGKMKGNPGNARQSFLSLGVQNRSCFGAIDRLQQTRPQALTRQLLRRRRAIGK